MVLRGPGLRKGLTSLQQVCLRGRGVAVSQQEGEGHAGARDTGLQGSSLINVSVAAYLLEAPRATAFQWYPRETWQVTVAEGASAHTSGC